MKTIGVFQLEQKKYDTIEFDPEFKGSVGDIPKNVHISIYGDSGSGKTEFGMRIARQFCKKELTVDWVSYEQSHGFDLQKAVMRNNMRQVAEYFQISDPHADKDEDISYFADFENKISKRGSADIFVIDSSKYCDFTVADFRYLFNNRRYRKKGFIWLHHKDGRLPEGALAKDIAKLGGITYLVKDYIAEPIKNRFGGNEKYVIFEERARLLNPKYFLELDKKAQKNLFNAEKQPEQEGVDAND